MILVDTTVWIEVFRRHHPLDLAATVDFESIVTCLPVVQEVLQGFREEAAFRTARDAMLSLPMVENPLPLELVGEAVDLYRTARRHGLTIRSSVDCLIAACALRHDLEVLHRDRDYPALARVSTLRQRAV
ncbi:MAG: type II toxin-antitoxin system VapC family toxin [Candidatus Xenobia bacterium]